MNFGILGNGYIAKKHIKAIQENGGNIIRISDPNYDNKNTLENNPRTWFDDLDYVVICSPSHLHRNQTLLALQNNKKVIVEKPAVLPWEPLIDDDRINIVLQLRWMELPNTADLVKIVAIRDEKYFKSWKGDPWLTGGIFFSIFIHYIDLAKKLNAKFEGIIASEGIQERWIDDINLTLIDMDKLYSNMYNDIINKNSGVKPKEIFYLHWLLDRAGFKYGVGKDCLNKKITLDFKNNVEV